MQTNVVIVGAGPAGIFTALEMLRKGTKQKSSLSRRESRLKTATAPRQRQADA